MPAAAYQLPCAALTLLFPNRLLLLRSGLDRGTRLVRHGVRLNRARIRMPRRQLRKFLLCHNALSWRLVAAHIVRLSAEGVRMQVLNSRTSGPVRKPPSKTVNRPCHTAQAAERVRRRPRSQAVRQLTDAPESTPPAPPVTWPRDRPELHRYVGRIAPTSPRPLPTASGTSEATPVHQARKKQLAQSLNSPFRCRIFRH